MMTSWVAFSKFSDISRNYGCPFQGTLHNLRSYGQEIAVPGDSIVKEKEFEEIEQYQTLKDEVGHVWKMNKVTVILVIIRALVGAISDKV